MSDQHEELASNRRLTLNVFWNFLGTGAPLLVGILAIPILIDALGTERFGVLALAWMIVGYFSLFDLGLGRALTQILAKMLGQQEHDAVPALVWTAMLLMTLLGVLCAVVAASLSGWLVRDVLNVPVDLQSETLTSFYILAASIPVVIGTTGLRGVLEAYQRFDLVNAVRIPLGVLTFLGPVAVLPFSKTLPAVIGVLASARLLSWVAYTLLCFRVEPAIRASARFEASFFRPLLTFGGWMTVTNIVGPLMVYMDRFLIGAVLSLSAVAYYATPFEVVSKLLVVPAAIMGVMFPAFSSTLTVNRDRAARLFGRVVEYVFLSLFPVTLLVVIFAHEGLTIWLDSEFAANSTRVLQLLMIGIFVNSHAQIPFGLIQGGGRPDLTAKLHLFELPVFVMLLWWLLNDFGIVGAAIAWVIRIIIDTVLLFVIAERKVLNEYSFNSRWLVMMLVALAVIVSGGMISATIVKFLYAGLVLAVFLWIGWSAILTAGERGMLRKYFV
jgi:O-antigen/teichoic acid export membrane protein